MTSVNTRRDTKDALDEAKTNLETATKVRNAAKKTYEDDLKKIRDINARRDEILKFVANDFFPEHPQLPAMQSSEWWNKYFEQRVALDDLREEADNLFLDREDSYSAYTNATADRERFHQEYRQALRVHKRALGLEQNNK